MCDLRQLSAVVAQRAFAAEGIAYSLDGETGNTVDSHRLAAWAFTNHGAEARRH